MPSVVSRKLLLVPIAGVILALVAVVMSAQHGAAQIPPVNPTPLLYPTPVTLAPFSNAPSTSGAPAAGAIPGFQITGDVSICGVANPGATGGQTISDSTGALTVTLVDGGSYSYGPPSASVGQPALAICHQQTNSTIVLSLATGKEIKRVVRAPLATSIFDHIVANTVLTGGASSFAPTTSVAGVAPSSASSLGSTSTAIGGQTGIVRPPSTGDGGLLP